MFTCTVICRVREGGHQTVEVEVDLEPEFPGQMMQTVPTALRQAAATMERQLKQQGSSN